MSERTSDMGPAQNGFAITPSDTTVFSVPTDGIWVGGAGDVAVVTTKGDSLTLVGALAGTIIPIKAAKVLSTGTTATNLVGLH